MYAKLDRLREELKKAIEKRDAADAKVKHLEAKLKEEENQQIVSDVSSYHLSPEQLAHFLQLTNSGKLQEMLKGQIPMPGTMDSGISDSGSEESNHSSTDTNQCEGSETDYDMNEDDDEEEKEDEKGKEEDFSNEDNK